MPKTLEQIQQQIAKLQMRAEHLRAAEAQGVIKRIKVAIAHYGLTAEQLGFGSSAPASDSPVRDKTSKPSKPVNRSVFADSHGNTWSGRGPRPAWLRDALAGGAAIESFRQPAQKKPGPSARRPGMSTLTTTAIAGLAEGRSLDG
ncbi:MAG: H-NS histone family protein [Alcaligenaceae bacterium]|nr:MAG: H-NS histone family protein [Alcaligenaceae bacterium]